MTRCWSEGSYAYWPSTPGGNEIEPSSLTPSAVITTANDMIAVASRMQAAAVTLRELAHSEDGQQGQAVERLRDSVGETYDILGDAGDLYYGTADAIRTYGNAIGTTGGIAEALSSAYATAEARWQEYSSPSGDLFGDQSASDPDDANAQDEASDNAAKYDAFQAWMSAADHWDQQFEDWETAWNDAVAAIEDAHDHGPKDGWNEWVGEFLEIAYIVLTVAAIVCAIIFFVCTFVISAPTLLAIATIGGAIIGVVTAAVSITRYMRGETDLVTMLVDVVCAVPGVGPVANLVSDLGPLVARLGVGASALADFLPGGVRVVGDVLVPSRAFADGVADMIIRGGTGAGLMFELPNVHRFADVVADLGIDTVISHYAPVISVNTLVNIIRDGGA